MGLMLVPIQRQGIIAYNLKAGVTSGGNSSTNGTTTSGASMTTVEFLTASIVVGIAGLML